jgi:uncharacterized protein with PIN domain
MRDANEKLVRRSYWLDMNDHTLVMVMTRGIGANLTNDEKRAHLIDLRREHLIDQVCIQEVLPVVISTNDYSPYGTACILCNDSVIAPNLSEYASERHVRHFWSCESCGHQFETSEHLRFEATSEARRKIRHLPVLVT